MAAISVPPVRASERMAILGKTGSGKTYFAQTLLAGASRLIVCDAKGRIDASVWNLVSWVDGYTALAQGKAARVRIPPLLSDEDWEDALWQIYQLRNVTVYIDELYGVGPARGSKALRALYTRGRELQIGVVACSQRPAYIPMFTLSESEWFVVFKLQLEVDVERMADLIGPTVLNPPAQYHYRLYNDTLGRTLYCAPLPYKEVKNGEVIV